MSEKSEPFAIRPARPSDYQEFAKLIVELDVPDPVPSETVFLEKFLPSMLVDASGDQVRGYVYFVASAPIGGIRNLVVAPSARGQKRGLALMQAAARALAASGCTQWNLFVKPANLVAIALYEKLGMQRGKLATIVRFESPLTTNVTLECAELTSGDDEFAHALEVSPATLAQHRGPSPIVIFGARNASKEPVGWLALDPRRPLVLFAKTRSAADLSALLCACARHCAGVWPKVVAHDPELHAQLLELGAIKLLETLEFTGALPPKLP